MQVWDTEKKEMVTVCDQCGADCNSGYETINGKDFCKKCLTMYSAYTNTMGGWMDEVSEED